MKGLNVSEQLKTNYVCTYIQKGDRCLASLEKGLVWIHQCL